MGINQPMERTAISWSGGKDSCLAAWKTVRAGAKIDYLLNTVRRDSDRVAFHGVRAELVEAQARSMNIPLIQRKVGDDDYREVFVASLAELKARGVGEMVFGDIDVRQNREWCEGVCKEVGFRSHFPLWGADQRDLLSEFLAAGFRALTVCVDADFFGEADLAKTLDDIWLSRLDEGRKTGTGSTHCGENGEYHTFVYDGPLFIHPINLIPGKHVFKTNHWLVDLLISPG
jgi:uncharacterized protein (TIGR00290 family)